MLIAATHPFISSLEHILGFLLVLGALILLWGVTVVIGTLFTRLGLEPVEKPRPLAPELTGPSEEEAAAIAAVVAAIMGPRSRVISIRSGMKDWQREGRREHFASHKIR